MQTTVLIFVPVVLWIAAFLCIPSASRNPPSAPVVFDHVRVDHEPAAKIGL